MRPARVAALRRDEHDAIGRARAVDGRGRGALQDRDVLDVVRVDVGRAIRRDAPPDGSSAVMVELSIGTPSTTNSGCALPDSDLMPRMRMYEAAPDHPTAGSTCTFGACPRAPRRCSTRATW